MSHGTGAIESLHHVTATVDGAQEDLDFYLGVLGLRLVKKTVNFDNRTVYHFYYGDERGRPGSILTTFPYRGKGVGVGTKGSGQVVTTAFSVPAAALGFWRRRFAALGVAFEEAGVRFGEEVIAFDDPSGLALELVGSDADERQPWVGEGIREEQAIRGIHTVTLSIAEPRGTFETLTDFLGLREIGRENDRVRMGAGSGATGHCLDVLHQPGRGRGVNGLGTVHHVALAIATAEAQLELRSRLLDAGSTVTEVRDRKYFQSIYFREPGGVLIEVATAGPGFTVDEPLAELGRDLKLPDWEEPDREVIESGLVPVRY